MDSRWACFSIAYYLADSRRVGARGITTLAAAPPNPTLEVDHEADGRFLAEVPELPGVLAYGATEQEAVSLAQALALRVLADRLENGEPAPSLFPLDFRAA